MIGTRQRTPGRIAPVASGKREYSVRITQLKQGDNTDRSADATIEKHSARMV